MSIGLSHAFQNMKDLNFEFARSVVKKSNLTLAQRSNSIDLKVPVPIEHSAAYNWDESVCKTKLQLAVFIVNLKLDFKICQMKSSFIQRKDILKNNNQSKA